MSTTLYDYSDFSVSDGFWGKSILIIRLKPVDKYQCKFFLDN